MRIKKLQIGSYNDFNYTRLKHIPKYKLVLSRNIKQLFNENERGTMKKITLLLILLGICYQVGAEEFVKDGNPCMNDIQFLWGNKMSEKLMI